MSPELGELIATSPFYRGGLHEVANHLPESDMELHEWMEKAAAAKDEISFNFLICAAAISGRPLQASLLRSAFGLFSDDWRMAWLAWHMEGNVTEELLAGMEKNIGPTAHIALALFIATAWWQKHRPNEECPRKLARLAKELSDHKNLSRETLAHLQALILLADPMGGLTVKAVGSVKAAQVRQAGKKVVKRYFEFFEKPPEELFYERKTVEFRAQLPVRRSRPKVHPNDPCHCGSNKKYKFCCREKDRAQPRSNSYVEGKTREELEQDPHVGLTEARLEKLRPVEVLQLDPLRVPEELQKFYILQLGIFKFFDKVADAFDKLGVPEHLHSVWSMMFSIAHGEWQPELARRLMRVFPNAPEVLGVEAHPGIRLLLVGDEPLRFFELLEEQARRILRSGDLRELELLAGACMDSPYKAIGVLLARGLLPIADKKRIAEIFDEILAARARIDLSPDDEFTDWVEQQTKRASEESGDDKVLELQDELDRKRAEERKLKEQLAGFKRKIALAEKKEKHAVATAASATTGVSNDAQMEEWRRKAKTTEAILRERSEERRQLRRERDEALEKLAKLEAESQNGPAAAQDEDEDDGAGEPLEVCGNQPTRLIKFPKNFQAAIAPLKGHVKRAGLRTIGHVASGEESAFGGVKNLKRYHGVLEKRVAGKHRVLFTLSPEYVWIVALIPRAQLDPTAEHLHKHGLPAYD